MQKAELAAKAKTRGAAVSGSARPPKGALAPLLLLFGATFGAILLTGSQDQGALGTLLLSAGTVLLLAKPGVQLNWRVWALTAAFLGTAALAFLPRDCALDTQWRQALQANPEIPIGSTISPVPVETLWWWALLAISVVTVLYVLTRPLRSRDQLVLANVVMACTTLYALLAIASELTGWQFAFDEQPTFGFFRNRNHTASFLITGAVVALGTLGLPGRLDHRRSRCVAGVTFAVCAIALISFSMSRAGVLFFAVGAAACFLGVQLRQRMENRSLAIGGMLMGVLLLFIVAGGTARQRILTLVQLEEGTTPSASESKAGHPVDFRALIFKDAWRIIRDYPWTGTGLGTFALIYPQYQQASLRNGTALHPESDWLMLACEAGLPSVACLLALLAFVSISIWNSRTHPYWPLKWGMFTAAAIAALHGLVDVPIHRVPLGWWVVLLGGASLRYPADPRPAHWSQRAAFKGIGVAALLAATVLIRSAWFDGYVPAPFRSVSTQQHVAAALSKGNIEAAIDLAETGIDANPLNSGIYHQLGTLLLEEGGTEGDVDRLFAAERLLQRTWPEIPYRQGMAWLPIDPARTAGLWKSALERQLAIDLASKTHGTDTLLTRMLRGSQDERDLQLALLSPSMPDLTWKWLSNASKGAFDRGVERLSRDPVFLASLSDGERLRFVQIWVARGRLDGIRAFLEKNAGWQEFSSPLRVRIAVDEKNFEAAVKLLSEIHSVPLTLPDSGKTDSRKAPSASNDPIERFLHHWERGREITARAALSEAAKSNPNYPEARMWQACLAAHDLNWPLAYEHLRGYLIATERLWN